MPDSRIPFAIVLAACAGVAACSRAAPAAEPLRHRSGAPVRADTVLAADSEIVPGRVARGATFGAMLSEYDLHAADIDGVLAAMSDAFDPKSVRAGQAWRVERTHDGCVRYLEYEIDAERFLRVTRGAEPHVFHATIVPYETRADRVVVAGTIDGATPSLFAATAAAGETPELAMALAAIFSGEVDFTSDLQPGDGFSLLVEKLYRDGRFVRYGPVQAARLVNNRRTLEAVRYVLPGKAPGYYDRSGRSLKRFFLRSPLRLDPQVTSGFSLARLHPVLHQVRAHLGVDYRAPVGAPIVAVATGVVAAAGWRGGGGKTVSIRHASGYVSSYLHLSSIAAGIRPGVHVAQGQTIGRVGATGLATGPHLDYRLSKNGRFINPLVEHRRMPPGDPIPDAHLDEFSAERDLVLARLDASGPAVEAVPARSARH
jgi:murein DD-endopeptidase MepM/ murein hydrolase activator NlpD